MGWKINLKFLSFDHDFWLFSCEINCNKCFFFPFSYEICNPQYIHKEVGVERPAFDEDAYLKGGALKDGEDKYDRNQFNQAASDAIGGDRTVPDTRHSQ